MRWGGARTRLDLRLALVLPVLVVVSCFAPLLGLMLRTASPWVSAVLTVSVAIAACVLLLKDHGVSRALALSTLSVVAGTGCLALVSMGLRALADGGRDDIANAVVTGFPLALVALAGAAIVWSFVALPGQRKVLAAVWVLALVTPLALAGPIGKLSDAAGNAGMDVVALFVLPFAAFFAWALLLIGNSLWPAASEGEAAANETRLGQSS